ncbi:thioredoxin family protein [Chitinophaga sp. Cy-1792]|uniref:thioredoxin family protein n=1 Tax=Chitinophaga sp. Cy-1792 TaxID=2608339 RepID=UPI001421D3E9|nr:thioredoxin family protein [Chitinophaga sp. Cy-1792]NIG57239.1 thioredoxin family protein [Chitinophaga sp. Cy-1792]
MRTPIVNSNFFRSPGLILQMLMILQVIICKPALAQNALFKEKDLSSALEKAKKEHKGLLLYCHTSWCVPCREIEQVTLKDSSISALIQANYVPLSYDLEEGFGIDIAKKYRLVSVPTIIILDSDLKVHFRSDKIPYQIGDFKKFINKAIAATNDSLSIAKGITADFKLSYPQFYEDYFNKPNGTMDSSVVAKYLATQTNLFSEVNWGVISLFPVDFKYYQFVIDNAIKFKSLFGDEVRDKIWVNLYKNGGDYAKRKDVAGYTKILHAYLAVRSSNDSLNYKDSTMYMIKYYAKAGDNWEVYQNLVDAYTTRYNMSYTYFWELIMQQCTPPAINQFFLKGISAKMEQINNPDRYLSYGLLLQRNCQQEEGKKYLEKSLNNASAAVKEQYQSLIKKCTLPDCNYCK